MSSDFSECHRMVSVVAPELRELYIVSADRFADLPCRYGEVLGWAAAGLWFDRNIADRLGDDYTEPRPLIALDADRIAAEPDACLLTVLGHELSHILPTRPIIESPNSNAVRESQLTMLKTGLEMSPQLSPTDANNPHDAAFVRRCCHVYFRAAVAGFDISPRGLFGPTDHWMSWPEMYVCDLLPELVALSDASFGEIESTEPPATFTRRWERDVEFFERNLR